MTSASSNTTHARRRQILAAAEVCFAQRGFHQTSMGEICTASGLSPGSVYRYFRSKTEIIAAMVEESLSETRTRFAELETEPDVVVGLHKLAAMILGDLDDAANRSLYFESTAEALRNTQIADLVRREDTEVIAGLCEALKRGQANGSIDPSLDAQLSAQTLIALIDGLMWRKFLNPAAEPAQFIAIVGTMLERFLRPPKLAENSRKRK
jgi:TetR/AcrR family transcriptional regulator, repressor for uid operon